MAIAKPSPGKYVIFAFISRNTPIPMTRQLIKAIVNFPKKCDT